MVEKKPIYKQTPRKLPVVEHLLMKYEFVVSVYEAAKSLRTGLLSKLDTAQNKLDLHDSQKDS